VTFLLHFALELVHCVVSITTAERKLTVGGFYKVNSPIMGGHIPEVGVCSGECWEEVS